MLSVALALLVAQAISVALLVRASEDRREAAAVTTLAFRLINGAERAERGPENFDRSFDRNFDRSFDPRPDRFRDRREGRERFRDQRRTLREVAGPEAEQFARDRLPRNLRYDVTQERPLAGVEGKARRDLTRRLGDVLATEGIEPTALFLIMIDAGDDPLLARIAERRPRLAANQEWRERKLLIASIQREEGGAWESARLLVPPRAQGALGVVAVPALITFALLLIVLFFVLRRITGPLAMLRGRVEAFAHDPENVVQLPEKGPKDTRQLIAAHNAMEARIAALLDEKDVMLGAIGHDLKTPLAALRVRIESVSDDAQRAKMAASIEDITATLDDILTLARLGRKNALETEAVDLGALASGVVEEFEDMGESVTMIAQERLVAKVQITWIKRALRNLVSNSLRYAGPARVSVVRGETHAILRVEDDGPGIPDGEIDAMLEPFARGEASRNRATGGAGLGLTLARAIAKAHGGELALRNRQNSDPQSTGLCAEIRLPLRK
ncbi:two-component sensor histidine kinase [Erythrobacter sp. SCSIO 43205]|nr:two-component sensor histidine kinase [Erythrobacter sp. SCSIO 43205]